MTGTGGNITPCLWGVCGETQTAVSRKIVDDIKSTNTHQMPNFVKSTCRKADIKLPQKV